MKLRQIALVAKDLEPVVADLCAVLVADRDRLFGTARARGLAIDGNRVHIGGVWFGVVA